MEPQNEQQVMSLKTEATGMMQWANGLTVSTQETANDAMQRLSVIKGMRKKVVDWFAPMKTAAAAAHKAIVAREKEITDVADQAEQVVKAKVISWQHEEADKAEAERKANAAAAKEEAKEETAAAVVAPVIDVAAPAATAAGTSTRKTHKAVDGLSVRGYSHRGWRVRFEAVSGLSTDRLPVVVVGIMAAIVYISL